MDNDPSVTIFKRSKTRTTRTRDVSPSGIVADNDESSTSTAPPSTLAAKLKKQHKERSKPKARLSFGGGDEEEDGEAFQVKKSKLSRKLKLASNALSGVEVPGNIDSTAQSSGAVYSKEYLAELKASTQSASAASRSTNETPDADMVFDESEIAGAVIVDEELIPDTISDIPSESSILAAKQRRERLRQTKNREQDDGDFISLSVARKEDIYQGPHPESRLMREDDDLGEGDDEFAEYTAAQERIPLGKKAKKKEATKRRTAMQEMVNDADEEDEETIEWERAQLRRATRRDAENGEASQVKKEYKPAQIPPPTVLPSLDAAASRLALSLSHLTTSHTTSTASMSNLADERLLLESKEKEMRVMVESAESKCHWFSSFQDWIETVATFLDEKYPQLEALEEEHISLLKERSDMISKRRTQDDEDDVNLFLGSLLQPPDGVADELDELGRFTPQTSTIAKKERRGDRIARHPRHVHSQEEEGFSTDSSLAPSDETDYQLARANLQTKSTCILQDVQSDEFRDPRKGVARWFGIWRKRYTETYSGAFGGLGIVSAWEFWARLEMLGWDPISEPRSLDSFAWFSALYDYSRPLYGNEDGLEDRDVESELGPDGDLVSAMLSTIVPRLCKVIQGGAFDPYSGKHLRAIINLAEQVEASASQEKLELLQKSVFTTFRGAIDDTVAFIHPYLERGNSTEFNSEAFPARRRFLTRRYKLLANLTRWTKYTGEKFAAAEMMSRLIQEFIRPIAETGWGFGGEEIMQKAVNIMPPELRNGL